MTAFLLAAFALCGCQSMEDTYSKYAGDGKIRYVGKCEEFTVTSGWERFVFNWTASADPSVKTIRIMWKSDTGSGSWDIPATENSFATEAIFDESTPLTLECYAVDSEGNMSLPVTQYARAFTHNHEAVTGFSRMVNKYFFIGDDVILFLDPYMEGMKSTEVSYWQDGEEKNLEITKAMFDATYLHLEDVDTNRDVIVNRTAEVEGCIDVVTFEPYHLDPEQLTMNFDFIRQLTERYNLTEVTPEFIRDQETLEIDYSISSLEDILYFPNLRKVVLGGNRFMIQTGGEAKILSTIGDRSRAIYAFGKMHDILGTEVEIYNNHFNVASSLSYAMQNGGNPVLPVLDYLDTTGWTITSSTNDNPGGSDPAYPERILDNDPSTLWGPHDRENLVRTHDLTIDMKDVKTLHGFKVTQPLQNSTVAQGYYPQIICVDVSTNGYNWEMAFLQSEITIGTNYGESSVMYMPEAKDAQYIRIRLIDRLMASGQRSYGNSCLGDFMPF